MTKGYFQIILSFILLIIAGCSENESFHNNNDNDKSNGNGNGNINIQSYTTQKKLVNSRFVSESDSDLNVKTDQKTVLDKNYVYYRPAEQIDKKSIIQALIYNDIRRNTIEIKKIPGKSLLVRSPFSLISAKTSQEVFFTAIFDNDIFDYTDYYFTNGISLELYHPAIGSSPISRILPGLKNSLNYYGLTLVQNMYTPRKLEELSIRVGDRPFAAYLTVGHQKISLSADRHRKLESEFVLGVIGPASLGNVAQDLIHSNTPVGWINQVKNDFVVNYSLRFDQGVYSGNSIEIAVFAGGQAGTLYDNIMAGLFLQVGKTNNLYNSLFQTTGHQKPYKSRVRYYFSLDLKNKLIIYDATMQGGMFNRESVYTFDGSQVNRYVFTGTASVGLGLGRYSLEAEQVFLTPEFDGGRKHLWFRIKNIISLK